MSVNSSDLIFDLSCLQGQIADVGISLQGLETQRLLNPELYNGNNNYEDEKKYIHDLTTFLKFVNSSDSTQNLNKGLSTFYISGFLYNAMLTLNKFVNEVEYDNKYKITGITEGVRPFNKTFSQDLYRLIKKGKMIQTKFNDTDTDDQPIIKFDKEVTNSFNIRTREDLLIQTNFASLKDNGYFGMGILESQYINSYQVVIPTTFMTSDNEFGNNMRKLLTDLYKEYYYYEIVDIQKRLNRSDSTSITNLDTNLRIMLQEVRNAFTRDIYSPDTDISTEFPLSNIITELNDFINDMESGHIGQYDNKLCLFDVPLKTKKIGLYQFIEEKSHMLNQTGNAYHYALELSKRIQRISDYVNKNPSSLGPDPHFNGISEFNEDVCIKGIDEALAILSNLTNDLHLTTGDNIPDCKYEYITNEKFNSALTHIEDIFHKYINFANDKNDMVFKDDGTDFNSKQLDSLGIIHVLKCANLFHYGHDGLEKSEILDYVFDGDRCKTNSDEYEIYGKNYKTQTYYRATKVSRYQNEYLYRTFSLIVIKIAIALAVLYIFRSIQLYNYAKKQGSIKNLRSTKDNEIERLLLRKIPNNLTITDYTTITHLRKELEKMKMQSRENNKETSFEFKLPINTDATVNTDDQISINDSLFVCYANILEFMNHQASDSNKLTISNFAENTFARLYPFTKSMLYQYDEYFSITESNYNKSNNGGSSEIKFGTILNGLNYVAQSIATDEYNYKVEHLEKTLTKIIYLCTCLTINWSDLDEITTTSIDNIDPKESPLSKIMSLKYKDNYGLFVNKLITMSKYNIVDGTLSAFKTTILGFILGEMKSIVDSSLPWVVKYVYWLSLYCINAYFIHLMKKNIKDVVVDLVTK